MEIFSRIKEMKSDKKAVTAVTMLGAAGLLLIMISSLLPESEKEDEKVSSEPQTAEFSSASYCAETEQRLEEFLKNIEGVGEVKVYLTVSTEEEYVYAKEGKSSTSENKTEEEKSYVMIGGGSGKTALIETVKPPEICGAVVACTGCDSPVIQEKIYKAVSTALGISTAKVYVTKLKGE